MKFQILEARDCLFSAIELQVQFLAGQLPDSHKIVTKVVPKNTCLII